MWLSVIILNLLLPPVSICSASQIIGFFNWHLRRRTLIRKMYGILEIIMSVMSSEQGMPVSSRYVGAKEATYAEKKDVLMVKKWADLQDIIITL